MRSSQSRNAIKDWNDSFGYATRMVVHDSKSSVHHRHHRASSDLDVVLILSDAFDMIHE